VPPERARTTGPWCVVYQGFDPAEVRLREALCTLGNGYFATRGAAPEASAGRVHYPGTYIAGCYDRLSSWVAARSVVNEDLVNAPNWLPLTFRAENGRWFAPEGFRLLEHRQELDLRHGLLRRWLRYQDEAGRVTAVDQQRLVSMDDPHLAAMLTTIRAENWSGSLELRSGLDARVRNRGVARYRGLADRHLIVDSAGADGDLLWLTVDTATSAVRIALACRNAVHAREATRRETHGEPGWIARHVTVEMSPGETVTVEKVAGLDNNAYTNVMAAWTLWWALDVLDLLPPGRRAVLRERLALTDEELARFDDVSRRLRVVFHRDGVISQFEGYEELAELDWEGYRNRYGDIRRLDRILEAEGDTR
jgi:trehalose/maltose hydrolase-like predicted phosphorylase